MIHERRFLFWYLTILGSFIIISARLFYWQILASNKLQVLARFQHQSTAKIPANRGRILSNDGFPLVSNQPAFLVYAYLPDLKESHLSISTKLAPLLKPSLDEITATPSPELDAKLLKDTENMLQDKLDTNLSWVALSKQISPGISESIDALNIAGIGFEEFEVRHYPEASLSAQLLGFVGSTSTGEAKGYFGIEGYYDLELAGQPGLIYQEKDAFGRPIIIGSYNNLKERNGRTLKTHIDRGVQLMVEKKLQTGLEKYGAVAGEVLIMNPHTGAIIAMASAPSYDPQHYQQYNQENYRIPSITDAYEPGSTFKSLVMAAAINEGVVSPDTTCDDTCNQPVKIGKYHIRTWNNEYHPGQSMRDVFRRSDNTGMIYIAFKLGKDTFIDYLNNFGIGHPTGIDLQEETVPSIRKKWGDIDLATGSFGQGLAVTSIQMLSAFSSLAAHGNRMEPHVVKQVVFRNKTINIKPITINQPISEETSKIMTDLLIESGHQAGANRIIPKGYKIAGKSGTAQIPISGHYDEDKTVASFIGFAPAHNPQFAMLVKLEEPTTSPWGMETAAPLWYSIAKDLFIHLNIAPEH